ncbi:MAG: muramoyltetrapeptide carboxypeptidase [Parcubacteria group bacterium GW2011_GWF2_38_8]|nr:MAG: muramoyltetrapeptide carboxypeptidase [Parcubacteria group bacterium GW2011_GWF2_38_8]
MKKIFPTKLKIGDEIRIIAPARSMKIINAESQEIANRRLADLGFKVTFGKHINESDEFASSSIKSRVQDLHEAFLDPKVKAILTVIGGFNSNQLLKYIDWNIIKNNPKIFCGYSDITALNNTILEKTGLVSYYGPHYSSFGEKLYFDYTLDCFKKCLLSEEPFKLEASKEWSDDTWYKDQGNRNLIQNEGWVVLNSGKAQGTIIGGNLCTLNLLQGTEYFPSLDNAILFIEDDSESLAYTFDRDLQSLIHQSDFSKVKGIAIGRFQKESKILLDTLTKIIKSKKELDDILIVTNVDFGHTDPKVTFPIGGNVLMNIQDNNSTIKILEH